MDKKPEILRSQRMGTEPPAAWLLARSGDVNMVWWCVPIAEVMSATAGSFFLRRAYRDMERSLQGRTKE